MSEHSISGTEVATHSLTANTVETLNFASHVHGVWVKNVTGTAAITIAVGGGTPTLSPESADQTVIRHEFVLPAQICRVWLPAPGAAADPTVVKLISSGTPEYSVCEGANRQGAAELELI